MFLDVSSLDDWTEREENEVKVSVFFACSYYLLQ